MRRLNAVSLFQSSRRRLNPVIHKPEEGEVALKAKAKLFVSERASVAALRGLIAVLILRGTKLGSISVKYLELILPKQN